MLVRFSVRGCLSFPDTVTLRLVPSDHRRIKGTRYESCFSAVSEYKIMRSLLVFGPSGAGKTNLLIALQFLLDTILEGWTPALLPSGNGPVSFAISLYDETSARSYDYSLSYTAEGIEEESLSLGGAVLYAYSRGVLEWHGPGDAPRVSSSEDILAQTAAFLPESEGLRRMAATVHIVRERDMTVWQQMPMRLSEVEWKYWQSEERDILFLLQLIDPSICRISYTGDGDTAEVLLWRHGEPRPCRLSDEAAGLRKMAALAAGLAQMRQGSTVIIDDLDAYWMTPVLQHLIRDFVHQKENRGQLLGVTHDLLLLDNDLFHPEQLWIARRGPQGRTQMWPISAYHLRSERRRLYDAYIKGEFNTYPFQEAVR